MGRRPVDKPDTPGLGPAVSQRWLIAGRVQGVGYRAWMVRQAHAAGVAGWVRNLPDGRVDSVVIGGAAALDGLYRLCRAGPADAVVTAIEVLPAKATTAETACGFVQRADGI